MKQSSEITILKFKMTILIKEKINKTHYMHNVKMKIFVTFKFLSSNKTQINKFDHFLTNSITINILNPKNLHLKIH